MEILKADKFTVKTTVAIANGIQEEDTAGVLFSLSLALDQHDITLHTAAHPNTVSTIQSSEQGETSADSESRLRNELNTKSPGQDRTSNMSGQKGLQGIGN